MGLRRALLYMPGDDLHKIQKAAGLGVDCICMDLEDAVAPARKQAARATIAQVLRSLDFGLSEKLVRVNALPTPYFEEDLATVLPARPHGIVLPKVQQAADIQQLADRLVKAEKQYTWPVDSLRIWAIVESPLGIINLPHICTASPRLDALIFGAEDLAVTLGAERTPSNQEVFYARSALVLHAAAFNLDAIDLVNNDFHDLEQLRLEAQQGAQMGYSGKQVIHPNQVPIVQQAFLPNRQKIAWAQEVVAAYQKQQEAGKGALGIEGKLVDMPVYLQAKKILARALAAGVHLD